MALWPIVAHAYDFEISATTVGQGDQIRRFQDGEVVLLTRRRVTQLLGLRVFGFLPAQDPDSGRVVPRLQLVGALRFDTDFAEFRDNTDEGGIVVVPELDNDQLDVLSLTVEGRDFLDATTDFRVGRQVVVDPLDYYAFDGGQFFFHPPIYLGVEGFGGFQVRGTDPLSSPSFEIDGTTDSVLAPDEPEALSPMFGGAIQTHGLRDVFARASYRRTFSTVAVVAVPTAGADAERTSAIEGIDEEKLAVSARARIGDGLHPYAGVRWNALTARADLGEAGVRVALHPRHAVTPAWAMAAPDFEGDSIWNLYSTEPYHDASLTYDVVVTRAHPYVIEGYARTLARRYANEVQDEVTEGSALHHGAGAGARLMFGRGFARVDGRFEDGFGGRTAGGDVSGRFDVLVDSVALEGRVTVLQFQNDVRAEALKRDMWSLGAQAGARWVLTDGVALHLLAEENSNQLYTSYLRLLAMLDLAYVP